MILSESTEDFIYRYCIGDVNEEERLYLEKLLSEDREVAAEYRRVARIWHYGKYAGKWNRINEDGTWNKIVRRRRSGKRSLLRYWPVAASAAVVIGVALSLFCLSPEPLAENQPLTERVNPGEAKARLILASGEKIVLGESCFEKITEQGVVIGADTSFLKYEKNQSDTIAAIIYNELIVPKGGEYHLQMADGTVVYLNADSRLKFPVLFNKERREVYLEGEAYFEVKASASHPFIVHTSAVKVNVLGTGFNLTAYENDACTQVTLVHGKVNVATVSGETSIRPSEQLVFNKLSRQQTVKIVKVTDFIAWKDGLLSFDAMPLKELAAKLERWYDVEFFFTSERLKKLKFSGAFKKYDDIRYVLDLISATTNVELIVKDRTVIVNGK